MSRRHDSTAQVHDDCAALASSRRQGPQVGAWRLPGVVLLLTLWLVPSGCQRPAFEAPVEVDETPQDLIPQVSAEELRASEPSVALPAGAASAVEATGPESAMPTESLPSVVNQAPAAVEPAAEPSLAVEAPRKLAEITTTHELPGWQIRFITWGEPQRIDLSDHTRSGVIENTTYQAPLPGGGELVICCNEFQSLGKDKTPREFLLGVQETLVGSPNGRLVRDRELEVAGVPGREMWIEHPRAWIRARVFLADKVMVQMFVTGSETALDSPEATRFLTSLEMEKR